MALAIVYGTLCHVAFILGVAAMIWAMYFGMSRSLGTLTSPWSWMANTFLIAQFPLLHSLLLTRAGQRALAAMAPKPHGATLATTTYAFVASIQILLLFVLWSPSGIIWWRAESWGLWLLSGLYAASWLVLLKAIADAGMQLQIGLLGWRALLRGVKPVFPDMPKDGLFRFSRQPIYLGFALTLWTVPTWTPDQLAVAVLFTTYCVVGPLHKERRFSGRHGARFEDYKLRTPYWLPIPRRDRTSNGD